MAKRRERPSALRDKALTVIWLWQDAFEKHPSIALGHAGADHGHARLDYEANRRRMRSR